MTFIDLGGLHIPSIHNLYVVAAFLVLISLELFLRDHYSSLTYHTALHNTHVFPPQQVALLRSSFTNDRDLDLRRRPFATAAVGLTIPAAWRWALRPRPCCNVVWGP